ncbi:hypothetical protein FEK35_25305 [Nocardia cyriacigeorgica]|uniref:Uncharacterized protein n=1 Tax=Nocardia cyriacigeorgica TaxID=135487 RepID=A0A5R8P7Z6_9NOCA|nr:hypothetical protein FEK35_25305 [Nocardia cyriacigeorgica]
MADGYTGSPVAELPTAALPHASTPLHRAARRLQSVLPPGWCVEIVDPPASADDPQSILRVVQPPE